MSIVEHQLEQLGLELDSLMSGAKSAAERIKILSSTPNSVRRYQPRLINREGVNGDKSYQHAVHELELRDKPYLVAIPGSQQNLTVENTTFRYYAEAEEAGRLYCEMFSAELSNLVIASLDVVYHEVKA